MHAIVEIAGQQFKVEKGQELFVHHLDANAGDKQEFDSVLLVNDGKTVNVGTPNVEGSKVVASVIEHQKGDKVIVFKKKRRKGYQKSNGHRQQFTKIKIEDIKTK